MESVSPICLNPSQILLQAEAQVTNSHFLGLHQHKDSFLLLLSSHLCCVYPICYFFFLATSFIPHFIKSNNKLTEIMNFPVIFISFRTASHQKLLPLFTYYFWSFPLWPTLGHRHTSVRLYSLFPQFLQHLYSPCTAYFTQVNARNWNSYINLH